MADSSKNAVKRNTVLILVVLLSLVVLTALIVLPVEQDKSRRAQADYGTMQYALLFDAGSSGSRLSVFSWSREAIINGTGIITQLSSCRNTSAHGISQYAVAADAAQSLVQCLQRALLSVPAKHHRTTPLFLGATAGMRLLQETNSSHAAAILEAISDLFSTYPFEYKEGYARVISGAEEGVFGWISVNYLLGSIDPQRPQFGVPTTGALDLGGASTQVTFISSAAAAPNTTDYYWPLRLYGDAHLPYTHSFLCWGLDEARYRYLGLLIQSNNYSREMENPCGFRGDSDNVTAAEVFIPPCSSGPEAELAWGSRLAPPPDLDAVSATCSGVDCPGAATAAMADVLYTLHGTSNSTECRRLVDELFPETDCSYPSCSFNGVYQPPLPSSQFLAFSGYYYQTKPVNLTGLVALSSVLSASNAVCNMSYDQIMTLPDLNPDFASRYCFTLKYAISLLIDGLRFPAESILDFRADVNGTDTAWALGYVINATNTIPVDLGPSLFVFEAVFVAALAVLGAFLLVLFLVVVGQARASKRTRTGYFPLRGNHAQRSA